MSIEAPTANFIGSNNIFDKQHSSGKSKWEFVKQLNIFQKVIVRGT